MVTDETFRFGIRYFRLTSATVREISMQWFVCGMFVVLVDQLSAAPDWHHNFVSTPNATIWWN